MQASYGNKQEAIRICKKWETLKALELWKNLTNVVERLPDFEIKAITRLNKS